MKTKRPQKMYQVERASFEALFTMSKRSFFPQFLHQKIELFYYFFRFRVTNKGIKLILGRTDVCSLLRNTFSLSNRPML